MKTIKFGGFVVGYKTIIQHIIDGDKVEHKILYELYGKDGKKVTEDKNEYKKFLNFISSEILRRIKVAETQLKSESRLLIPIKEKYVIVKIEKVDKKGNVKKWDIEYIVDSVKEQDSGLFKEKNGSKLIVGYWEEIKLPKQLVARKIKNGDIDEEDWKIINNIMKNIKIKW